LTSLCMEPVTCTGDVCLEAQTMAGSEQRDRFKWAAPLYTVFSITLLSWVPQGKPMIEVHLGPSVRRLRTSSQLSLRDLAERTGFSASFLSQVENGQASPSIASMERIAAALGVTMGQFFQATESSPPAILRATARVTLNSQWSKARIEALSADVPASRIQPVLITLDAGGTSGAHPHTSPREEFAFVLDGTVVLTLAETEQVLECGDAAMIRAGVPRRWQNLGEGPARIVVVSAQ
jgi:transcriptional regulator with XRE-family HTH domain